MRLPDGFPHRPTPEGARAPSGGIGSDDPGSSRWYLTTKCLYPFQWLKIPERCKKDANRALFLDRVDRTRHA